MRHSEPFFVHSLDMFCVCGFDGSFERVNPSWTRNLGYSIEELSDLSFLSFVHPEDHKRTSESFARLVSGERVLGLENRYRCKDGRYLWLHWTATLFSEKKTIYAIARPLDDRRHRERKLERSLVETSRLLEATQANYLELFEKSPNMYVFVDAHTARIKVCNQTLVEKTGFSKAEIVGRLFFDMYHEECQKDVERAFWDFVGEGRVENTELVLKRKDGSKIPVLLGMSTIRDETGRDCHSMSWRDISDLKRVQSLETLAEELTRSNRELEDFAYVTSHDLKAPLRGIRAAVDWLHEELQEDLSANAKENLAFLRSRAERLSVFIEGVLLYSRVGRAEQKFVDVDVGELLSEVLSGLGKQESVCFSELQNFPVVRYDRTQLFQVFQNLLSNAVRFVGVHGRVEIGAADLGDKFRFAVIDDGPGVAPEHQDLIFGLFATLRPREESSSNGVGLSLCKAIVERNGGEIGVVSAKNQGSTFWFTVPKHRVES